ncbi:MAG: glycosyltransferase family 4 protein [Proteobacteria bacterium]|nr:glycosyltransferase family 4 protein [Pseudomonadota bacterium]
MAEPPAWSPEGPTLLLYGGLERPGRIASKVLDRAFMANRDVRALRSFLAEHRVRAMLVDFLDGFLRYMPAVQGARVRWYSFGHGFDVSRRLDEPRWLARYRAHGQAEGVFVRADCIRERLVARVGLDPKRVHVVRGGIDVPDAPLPHPADGEVRVLAVGRFMAKKGPLQTLAAFRVALERVPDLRLEMIGDGPLMAQSEQYVHEKGLEDRVTLRGAQPPEEVQRALASAHIFVQHSRRDPVTGDEEGLPASITEAMAAALPVVSTRHAGIPEAVREGEEGYLVEEGDVRGMAERIARLARDASARQEMGESGWRRAREMFRWEQEREALLSLMRLEGA